MTDIGLVKDKIEAKLAEATEMCTELKKCSTDTSTLVNNMIALYEGQIIAYKEILEML